MVGRTLQFDIQKKGGSDALFSLSVVTLRPLPAHFLSITWIIQSGGASVRTTITVAALWGDSGGALAAVRGRFFIANSPRLIHNVRSILNFSSSPQNPPFKSFFFRPIQPQSAFIRQTCRPSSQSQNKPTKANQTHQKPLRRFKNAVF
jgi:hypothetical protein